MAPFLDVIVEDGLNYASDRVENNFAGKLGRLPANGANSGHGWAKFLGNCLRIFSLLNSLLIRP